MSVIPNHKRRSLREKIINQSISRDRSKLIRKTVRRLSPIDETGTWTTVLSVQNGGRLVRKRRTIKKR